MDKKEADKVIDEKVQPLTPTQRNIPTLITVGGYVALFLTLGMQQAIDDNPDQYKGWGDTKNISMILGGVAALIGPYLSKMNDKTHQAALVEAAKAPPVDPEGNRSSRITLVSALKQAALEDEEPELVHGITNLLFPSKVSGSIEHEDMSALAPPKGGA